ncbi:MAG: carbamate kinase [Candidatus Delongbacteria bacterium]|nr:carbamate kinase [bacterium]MBL7033500.1 carbamate kinase [Candidatus Delongbacteria bacterium]
MSKTIIIALGGNAITLPNEPNTIPNQFRNVRRSLTYLEPLLTGGHRLVITHGNGPQVGVALSRVEATREDFIYLPLGILDADTQGGMGYMIEQLVYNSLRGSNIQRPVATLVTQVIVDEHDPSLKQPTKFIGKSYNEAEARYLQQDSNWVMRQDTGRGWRRVVGSPVPCEIVNAAAIKALLDTDHVVIACGGGGIPVYRMPNGALEGVDAVIDKDRTAALLGTQIKADEFYILTEVERVSLNFGTPDQQDLDHMTLSEARRYLAADHFPPGSMGPKIQAAINFLEQGGRRAVITSFTGVAATLAGKGGTFIEAD